MKLYFKPLAILTLLGVTSCLNTSAEAQSLESLINPDWAKSSLWDDGQAEVAEYEGHRVIYGEDRPHTARLITVKEDFNLDYNVKADWPYGDKPIKTVLKQNQVATIETPNYPYHYMASVFHDRENLADARKLTISSQEWCGITTKSFDIENDEATQTYISYWDGQGTGTEKLESYGNNVFFEEELPLLVRSLNFIEGTEATFSLYPNLTVSRAWPEIAHEQATLQIATAKDDLEIPAGQFSASDLWKITVKTDANQNDMTFIVTKKAPNTLLAYDFGDSRKYELVSTKRDAYWN